MSSKVAKRSVFAEKMKKVSENQTPNRKVNFNFQIFFPDVLNDQTNTNIYNAEYFIPKQNYYVHISAQ